jgi:hypothetical protein
MFSGPRRADSWVSPQLRSLTPTLHYAYYRLTRGFDLVNTKEPEQKTQLVELEIDGFKQPSAIARVGRLDQAFQHIERRGFDAVSE